MNSKDHSGGWADLERYRQLVAEYEQQRTAYLNTRLPSREKWEKLKGIYDEICRVRLRLAEAMDADK